jgi:8-oxo-dGTP diphosphatase
MPPLLVVAALVETGRRGLEPGRAGEAEGGNAGGAECGDPGGEARVFLARRSADAGHGGLWELPGGKVEEGESAHAALLREIREELGVGLSIQGPPRRYESEIGGREYSFIVFPATFLLPRGQDFSLAAHDEWRYFSASELGGIELAPLDGPALEDWAAGLGAQKE